MERKEGAHGVRTVLWFSGRGQEAAGFYCRLIPDSRVEGVFVTDQGGPQGDMHVEVINLRLAGVPYQLLEAGPMFPLSECVSVMVETPDQAETDRLWEALAADGGSHGPCGWLKDRYGLSWQVVPSAVHRVMEDPDPARRQRAVTAVMGMGKIDLAAVLAAAG